MILFDLQEPDPIQLSDYRRFILPSCAERKISAIKKPDNYSEKFYTVFPEGKMPAARFFLSPDVNWLEKPRS